MFLEKNRKILEMINVHIHRVLLKKCDEKTQKTEISLKIKKIVKI